MDTSALPSPPATSAQYQSEIRTSTTSPPRQAVVRKSFSSLADMLVATVDAAGSAAGADNETNLTAATEHGQPKQGDAKTEPRQQELTGLGFSVRPYDGDAFSDFKGGNLQTTVGTPRRESSAVTRPVKRNKDKPLPLKAVRSEATSAAAAPPTAALLSKRRDVAPPRHIKPAAFVALPPLRSRRGCLGISNRWTFAGSAYEDKLRALGMTKAGTAGLQWGERVIEYPGENGPAHLYTSRCPPREVGSPDVVDGHHPMAYPSYPHSMKQVLSLEPNSWDNTEPPRPHAPAFLQVPRATQPTDAFPTRYGTNTEWPHNSFVTVQAEPSSHYYMGEKERLRKAGWIDTERGRKRGVAKVPGAHLEVVPTY
ncbi:hypothetical protein HDU87_003765 [Geranomyces variabilis]|uniref:Uncharacterized protein n=1 Tax=Geranomyces variabilis TaxID=109894 RepID=A0AAD5TJC9_9FUNG|nr:hypothetical protein HDU87_003765 [Geranomyces variabilis]